MSIKFILYVGGRSIPSLESGNRDIYEFTVYKCWCLPIFHYELTCETLNVDSFSLYRCLERTNLINLCPTFFVTLHALTMFCYIVSNWKWMKEAFNDWIIWCFIKVANWCSGEQCGSWSWQKLVSQKNQNVCSHYQNDDRQIVNLHRKKDTDNKNRKYFVKEFSFFIC